MFRKMTSGVLYELDPRLAQIDLIGGPLYRSTPETHQLKLPTAEYQSWTPFCVSYASETMIQYEWSKKGVTQDFSERWLASRSETSKRGAFVKNVLDVARKEGVILSKDCPMLNLDAYRWESWDTIMDVSFLDEQAKERGRKYSIKGYAQLPAHDRALLKSQLLDHPIGITIGLGRTFNERYRNNFLEPTDKYSVYHMMILRGWDKNDDWLVQDSLGLSQYTMSKDYEIGSAWIITDLPNNWKELQEIKKKMEFEIALAHYGQKRRFNDEVNGGAKLLKAFKRFKNQSVLEAAGRFWTVYINALVYGGYSTTDLVNDCYHWRRTGQHAFNLNNLRK